MGWFDKKSWQLRRKIRDLQAELAAAERDGKYVVEQGLFFAELQEMGDNTLMVLGTANHLDSEEEEIVRNFFERNGFTVEKLRLDKPGIALAAIEIIPPQELTRHVAKALKEAGYRLVDDSEHERASCPDEKMLTLSGIIRAVSALFATFVHQLIINNEAIKMNMEGNRLLHWMPLVRDALRKNAGPDLVTLCREPFVEAYNHYYGQLGRMEHPEILTQAMDEVPAATEFAETFVKEGSPAQPSVDGAFDRHDASTFESDGFLHRTESDAIAKRGSNSMDLDAALNAGNNPDSNAVFALAVIYKSLIGASGERRVRNAETVLEAIAHYFGAKSACLLSRSGSDTDFRIESNSPGSGCIETNDDGAIFDNIALLQDALANRGAAMMPVAGNGSSHIQAAVISLSLQGGTDALVYLDSPRKFKADGHEDELNNLRMLTKVFREFPDLLISDYAQKNETSAEA